MDNEPGHCATILKSSNLLVCHPSLACFKGQYHEIFYLYFFYSKDSTWTRYEQAKTIF